MYVTKTCNKMHPPCLVKFRQMVYKNSNGAYLHSISTHLKLVKDWIGSCHELSLTVFLSPYYFTLNTNH